MTISTANALVALLGTDQVLQGAAISDRYITDWSEIPGKRPCVLIRPRTTEEVSTALKYCHDNRIAVITQGGLTGLVGGATVHCGESIVISMERMNNIEQIDAQSGVMLTQAGALLQTVQNTAADQGLHFGVDFGSRGSCTVGGMIATNAGGNGVIQYGMMRDQVLGMEVVLADGTVLPMLRPMVKNNTGYDLKHFFIGSEGTLGIVTRVMLRLHPEPQSRLTALVAFPGFAGALELLKSLRANMPNQIAAFELMWQDFWQWSLEHQKLASPFADTYPLYSLIDLSGTQHEQTAAVFETVLEHGADNGFLLDATIAQSQMQAQALWKIREAPVLIYNQMHPPVNFDVSVPLAHIGAFADACVEALSQRWPGHVTIRFGHIGDGNLHLSTDGAYVDGDESAVEAVIYQIVADFGGSVSAEHGIGLHKKPYLSLSRSPQEIEAMRLIKQALDPYSILNPGKIFDPKS